MRSVLPLLAVCFPLGGCFGELGVNTDAPADSTIVETSTSEPSTLANDTATAPDLPRIRNHAAVPHEAMPSLVVVRWQQERAEDVRIEYSIDPGVWSSTPLIRGFAGTNEQVIAGIPFATGPSELLVPWRVVPEAGGPAFDAPDPIVAVQVDPDLPLPFLIESDPSAWEEEGDYLLTSINQENGGWTGGRYWVAVYDRQGRPVWARRVPNRHWSLYPQLSADGTYLLWDEATKWSDNDDGEGSLVHRTFLDREIDVIPTPGLHHGFVELPNGALAWGSQSASHGELESIVEKDAGSPVERVVWRCEDWLEEPYSSAGCESSGISYSQLRNSYIISLFTNGAVVEVDRNIGAALWWAGELPSSYGFSPTQSSFSFPYGVNYSPTGTLLVSTELVAPRGGGAPVRSTGVREYKLQMRDELLVEEWVYDSGVLASSNGHVERLPSGNTLHLLGSASQVVEVDRAGRRVWHIDFDGSRLLGRGEFLPDLYALMDPYQ